MSAEYLDNSPENVSRWNDFVSCHPQTTIYHLPAFRNIFQKGFGYSSYYLTATKEEKIEGCLPLFLINTPGKKRLTSIPFRDRGGILSDNEESADALLQETIALQKRLKANFIEIRSLSATNEDAYRKNGFMIHQNWVRSSLALALADNLDKYLLSIDGKVRNKIKQAFSYNLKFTDVNNLENGLGLWYGIYLKTQKKLGIPPIPKKYFEALNSELAPLQKVKIFIVYLDQKAIAGSINLLDKEVLIYAYSASDPYYLQYRPNDFMIFKLIEWGVKNKYATLDMGSDSIQQESLLDFKRKWLVDQTLINIHSYGDFDASISDSSDKKYQFLRKLFSCLPVSILNLSGKIFTRHFG